jgi:hypothetical protein
MAWQLEKFTSKQIIEAITEHLAKALYFQTNNYSHCKDCIQINFINT